MGVVKNSGIDCKKIKKNIFSTPNLTCLRLVICRAKVLLNNQTQSGYI